MIIELLQLFTRVCVEDLHGAVFRARHGSLAVVRKGDRVNPIFMTFEFLELLARVCVPDSHGLVT
jgi:hypothetical protein